VCPGHGVYVARAGDATAAVNVGVRPTFGMGLSLLVEAYLLDRDEDLYGTELRLEFITRLRGERRFDSAQELIDQMAIDVAQARELCA
jgi:riboflavin kinase / FMN adenylyltransferase